ncbi:hypothetical protein [Niallia sp. 03133]|uniref:hypothetical protein n=1 Tax=Niallia sp. 03133 TaxID=3458060 RepID=UPI0040443BCB
MFTYKDASMIVVFASIIVYFAVCAHCMLQTILFLMVLLVIIGNSIINIYISKKEKNIHKWLKKRQWNPYSRFIYSMANQDDKGVVESYRKLVTMKRYKQKYPYFTVLFSLYFENWKGVEDEIYKIKSAQIRLYYQILYKLKKDGNILTDEQLLKIKRNWMKEVLLAEQAGLLGQKAKAKMHAKLAINTSRGMAYYQLKKYYERKYKR